MGLGCPKRTTCAFSASSHDTADQLQRHYPPTIHWSAPATEAARSKSRNSVSCPNLLKAGFHICIDGTRVGSDPANMATSRASEDGEHRFFNGEKLWCTNGVVADVIIVMAKTGTKTPAQEKRSMRSRRSLLKQILLGSRSFIAVNLGIKAIENGFFLHRL